jgi:hypothetical protein
VSTTATGKLPRRSLLAASATVHATVVVPTGSVAPD